MKTLLLDSSWRPVKFVKETRALVLIFKDKADLVAEWENEAFATPTQKFSVPAIVRLKKYVTRFSSVSQRFKRKVLYNRDDWTCQYCMTKLSPCSITIDHIVPRSAGGKTSWLNCVAACRNCNRKKGNKPLKDSGVFLRRQPKEPTAQHYWNFQDGNGWHPEWSSFIVKSNEK